MGGLAEEIEAEQGVIVEHAEGCADYSFPIALGIPCDAQARLNVVAIGLNAFLDSQELVSGLSGIREPRRRGKRRREFHVIAHSIIESEIVAHPPGILPKQAQSLIGKRVGRIAETLHESVRHAKTVGFY